MRGAGKVKLIEGHAATRQRWSACTTTKSDCDDIPGLELMFKADGERVQETLRKYLRGRGWHWLTVATSPKGSYREEHILNFLEAHLQKWGPGRKWRVYLLDCFAPQMTDNVKRLCWERGYILLIHGGGATAVTQTNDTDLHQFLRKLYTQLECAAMVREQRVKGKGVVVVPREEQCIEWMVQVWSRPELHQQAKGGYKKTGITVALDGSEDEEIKREAREIFFHEEVQIPRKREEVLEDVSVEWAAGRLRWTYEDIYGKLVTPYPNTGHLDVTVEFQDDEDVLEEDAPPWAEPEGDEEEGNIHGSGEEAGEPGGDEEDVDDEFAGQDLEGGDELGDKAVEGHGEGNILGEGVPALSAEEAQILQDHAAKVDGLKQAIELMERINDRPMAMTLRRALHHEERQASLRAREKPEVMSAMSRHREEQRKEIERERREFHEDLRRKREVAQTKRAAAATKAELAKAQKLLKEAQSMLETKQALKTFSTQSLGAGHPNGGTATHRKRRLEVMDRIAAHAELTGQQRNDWEWFREEYDVAQAASNGSEWGEMFAEMMQSVLDDLLAGRASAVSEFMYKETKRVLNDVKVLRV